MKRGLGVTQKVKMTLATTSTLLGAALAISATAGGCTANAPATTTIQSTTPTSDDHDACAGVVEGCACESPGLVVDCGKVVRRDGDYASCSNGKQTCLSNGRWGACVGDGIATRNVKVASSSLVHTQDLAAAKSACDFNVCDPWCAAYVDTPINLDAGTAFKSSDAGLGLAAADAGVTGSTCTGLSPLTNVNMVVTSINPVTTSPAAANFTTSLLPAGCLTAPLTPLWGNSRFDLGVVNAVGSYTQVVPVPATVNISAYAGSFSVTGTVNVTVDVTDTSAIPSGVTAANFSGTTYPSTEAAPVIVYPYDQTVFPLGLSAPLVMWKRATASAAKAVKISLRYPTTGTATFQWSAIVAEGSQRYQIPQTTWAAFDQTAKGNTGLLTVQRFDSTNKLQAPVSVNVKFATANLRGRIYYTNYASTPDVKVVFPYGTAAPTSAFTPPLASNCGVCHSLSASGNKFVTSSQGASANNGYNTFGISNVSATTGAFTALHPGPAGSGDSRGLAYAAVTRTGSYVLLANNWWGNPNNGSNTTTPGTAGAAFKIYQLPSTATAATDVSSTGFGTNWGLGGASPLQMYAPSFSPDNQRLVYVNGDATVDSSGAAASAAGSRQGISTLDFDETLKKFSGRKTVAKMTASGTPANAYVRWPMWEIDSRSIMFQSSPTTVDDGFNWYAGMLPSGCCGRIKVKGQLWSMDAGPIGGAPNTPVALTKLNAGLGASSPYGTDDTNRNYQPTMLPVAAGGYRWAVFTSVRAYGNLLNNGTGALSTMTNKLWVAALSDSTSAATDRSNPAFFLPNQDAAAGTLVERGYWTLDACKAPDLSASTCSSNEECCGYNSDPAVSTAACVVDSPLTSPATFHCKSTSSSVCRAVGQSCTSDSSCCGFPTTLCVSGTCQNPPPIATYSAATYTRDYYAVCRGDQYLEWRFFDYTSQFPGGSGASIQFSAATADTSAGLDTATPVALATQTVTNTAWLGANVSSALAGAVPSQKSRSYLRVTIAMTPTSDGSGTPLLTNWRQSYACIDDQ